MTAFLDIYISKRWFPGPGERSSQVIKLTKSSLVSKTIHMHFKEKEKVSPFSSFSKVSVLTKSEEKEISSFIFNRGSSLLFFTGIGPYTRNTSVLFKL